MLVTVRTFRVPTLWALLAGVRGIHLDDLLMVQLRLVDEFLLQVVERPRHHHVPVAHAHLLGGVPDAGEVFEHEYGAGRIVGYECLGDAMVHIIHPTVFSIAYPLQAPSRARRALLLQLLAQVLVVGALGFHLAAGHEPAPTLAVVGGDKEVDATVDADHVVHVLVVQFGHFQCDGDVQVVLAVFLHELGGSQLVRTVQVLFHASLAKAHLDAPLKRVHTERVALERVVAAVAQVELRLAEPWLCPLAVLPVHASGL